MIFFFGSLQFRVREKQKGGKNFITEDLEGLKELTLASHTVASAVTVGMCKCLAKTADFDKCEPLDLFFAIL